MYCTSIRARERACAERAGESFCLVTFDPGSGGRRQADLQALLATVRLRLQATDDLGWVEHGRLAVVLSCTRAHGAWTFAEDVCIHLPRDCSRPIVNVYCYPAPGLEQFVGGRLRGFQEGERPVRAMQPMFVRPLPHWKRGLDITGSLLALLLLWPLLLLIAVLVRLTSTGPAVFRQYRAGLGGRPFLIYKFRSMVVDAEAKKRALRAISEQDGPAFKLKQDPRVTPLGRFLRATSLDELPQLWNVLKGDMSLVGPRPLPCDEAAGCNPWQSRRLDVTPGITCLWQVQGRSQVTFTEWARMDVQYIRRRSLRLDLRLLLLTIPAVLFRRGAC